MGVVASDPIGTEAGGKFHLETCVVFVGRGYIILELKIYKDLG